MENILLTFALEMRRFLNKLSSESNLFVALGVYSLVKLSAVLYGVDLDMYANFSFIASLNVYSYSILYSKYRFNREFIFSRENIIHKTIFILSSVILPFYIIEFSFDVILMLIPLAFVSFLYPVGVKSESDKNLALRELPYLKIFLISLSWALVTLVIPLYYSGYDLDSRVLVEFFVRVAFVMAITLPFDIRDVKSDKESMRTLPQVIGVRRAKLLSYLLIVINIVFYYYRSGNYSFFFVLAVFTLLLVLVSQSNRAKDLYFFNILIESSSILLFISVLL